MPYKDPEKRRAYQRQRRTANSGVAKPKATPALPLPVRVQTAKDVLALVADQMAVVQAAEDASTCERARTIGTLAGVALRAIEAADVAARLEQLEVAVHFLG